jgi:two-component system, NarL family, invasion response regulator UvrY
MISILVADDHPIFRNGLRHIIEEEDDMALTEASSGKEVLCLLAKAGYDVLVLDIEMPDINGLEVLKQVKLSYPSLPVLMLSFYSEEQYAVRALKLGANGYLTKESAASDLVKAVKMVISGKKYITQNVAEKLSDSLRRDDEKPVHELLSDREYQVFCMIAEGKSSGDISKSLNLSPKTISTYKARIYDKMDITNDVQIVRYAIENHLVK